MHDILELDRRGLPGAVIATEAFESAAAAQSQALGFQPAMVYVPHPIQNRTAEELDRLADEVVDSVLEKLRSQPA
ncbi:MAG TPA: hypothetical protein EYG15_03110 [Deltaproteobacteria bacterium]|nr:hypothetical protein [SAR324 cluster bacterium]HIL15081.1 hypothetical protein [Deltaproteobacteria bacterium]